MMPRTDAPKPRSSEAHPLGYDYRARFPDRRRYAAGEGGSVYVADAPDGYYVITVEGAMADFLDDSDPLIHVHAFDTAAQRDAYCAARFARLARPEQGRIEGPLDV